MFRKSQLLTVLLVFSLVSCASVSPRGDGDGISDEEYEVYSTVIKYFVGLFPNEKPPKVFVVKELTTDYSQMFDSDEIGLLDEKFVRYLEEAMKTEIDISVLRSFKKRNKKNQKVEKKFDVSQDIVIITNAQLEEIFSGDGWWPDYYKKYPNSDGYHDFSRIGFSWDKKQAFVYYARHCGGLCGSGVLYLLHREKDEWIVKGRAMIWIS